MDAGPARALAAALAHTARWWRPAPFHDDPPWVHDTPALAGVLLSLPDARLDALGQDPDALQAFIGGHCPDLVTLCARADACLDARPPPPPLALPETAARDVPGRKWRQVLHFAAGCLDAPAGADVTAVEAHHAASTDEGIPGPGVDSFVEWCSGKAHLGRLLARHAGLPVTAVERDPALCRDGAALAARDGLPVTFRVADALAIAAPDAGLHRRAHALALHACGDLHVALLRQAAGAQTAAIDIAPCCYHLTRDIAWQPLSRALAGGGESGGDGAAPLALSREELRLCVQETVTAGARVVRQQRQLAAWRLGFDALQRELRGVDAYLPTPSRSARVLADGFPAFCAGLAAHHGMHLPAGLDYDRYAQRGEARLARVRRLELLRHASRRPLEVLVAADRALFLAEQGYDVALRTFCPRPLTPRNLLIQARRR